MLLLIGNPVNGSYSWTGRPAFGPDEYIVCEKSRGSSGFCCPIILSIRGYNHRFPNYTTITRRFRAAAYLIGTRSG